MDDATALATEIEAALFRTVMHRGYQMPSTDELLVRLAEGARAGEDVVALIDGAELRRNRWEVGYRRADVDAFLQRLRDRAGAPPGATKT